MARSPKKPAPLTMSPSDKCNAMVLRRSRHTPQAGDVFILNMRGSRWIIGRVIRDDANVFAPGGRLLYFYDLELSDPGDIVQPLLPRLLIPPIVTNDVPWRQGVYAHRLHAPLTPEEVLPRHVFRTAIFSEMDPRRFRDEYGRVVDPPPPGYPCGEFGLAGYSVIDDQISDAIGIPRVPR